MSRDIPGTSRLNADTRMECRICWNVYDPEEGDPVQQIVPGTAFLELPDYWRCPQCDAAPGDYLPIDD